MNDHQQIAAERGRRAADLRAAAVALLEQQSIAAGVMLDLDSDQVVAAGPKAAILYLLSNDAPATASGDELAKWHEPSWQKGYSAGYNDALGDVRAASTSTSPVERAASSAGEPDEEAPKFPEPGCSNSLADRVFNLPCNWKGDQALHSAILMGHTMACEQAYNLVMADEQARAAVSAATKPTADLPDENECWVHIYPSDLKRMERTETHATVFSVAVGRAGEVSVPLYTAEQVQSLLAIKPAAVPVVQEELRKALQTVARWELPPTGKTWDDGSPMSYATCYGSNGERDYMRQVALNALAVAPAASTPAALADPADSANVTVPRALLARCVSSMKAAVTFGETGRGRPPAQTCMFEIEDLQAALSIPAASTTGAAQTSQGEQA